MDAIGSLLLALRGIPMWKACFIINGIFSTACEGGRRPAFTVKGEKKEDGECLLGQEERLKGDNCVSFPRFIACINIFWNSSIRVHTYLPEFYIYSIDLIDTLPGTSITCYLLALLHCRRWCATNQEVRPHRCWSLIYYTLAGVLMFQLATRCSSPTLCRPLEGKE